METIVDKIKNYQGILTTYVENLAKEYNESLGSLGGYQAITDLITNQFQLIQIGWLKEKFHFYVLLHFSIHPETGNIWVQQNNTEIELDAELEALGVPKSHLVLGFRPADLRALSEYAVM